MSFNALIGASIHDGTALHHGKALLCKDESVVGLKDLKALPAKCEIRHLDGGYLTRGFVDLQVNGGGGVMFNDAQTLQTLEVISEAHQRLGIHIFLPTLITDTQIRTQAAIEAVVMALEKGVPGIVGIHLEGPHLSLARKGAHDPSLIRAMSDGDLCMLTDAARRLPNVMLTIAPESVTLKQARILSHAGVILSLGHTNAD